MLRFPNFSLFALVSLFLNCGIHGLLIGTSYLIVVAAVCGMLARQCHKAILHTIKTKSNNLHNEALAHFRYPKMPLARVRQTGPSTYRKQKQITSWLTHMCDQQTATQVT
jgi:hypothetical protein